jgi:hypothetical protein
MRVRPSTARCAFAQFALSSLTQGQTRRPCRVHFSSVAVSVIVTLSIFPFLVTNIRCSDLQKGAVISQVVERTEPGGGRNLRRIHSEDCRGGGRLTVASRLTARVAIKEQSHPRHGGDGFDIYFTNAVLVPFVPVKSITYRVPTG